MCSSVLLVSSPTWRAREATIRSLGSHLRLYPGEVGKVRLLGCEEPLAWSRDADGLKVRLPAGSAGQPAYALKIEPAGGA